MTRRAGNEVAKFMPVIRTLTGYDFHGGFAGGSQAVTKNTAL
jgi:hypothetical protein